jgi:hypothetical protein
MNEELTDSEKLLIQEQNIKMLLRELDKVNLRYKDMFSRNTLLEVRSRLKEKLELKRVNRSYIQGSIDTIDFVLSKKEPKEILLQK